MTERPKVRLYVDQSLAPGQSVVLSRGQARHVFAAMRMRPGGRVALFNGRDGEWAAEVVTGDKRGGTLECRDRTAPLRMPPDLWLLFAPIKKARTDFIVEKAAEMGVARICPVMTEFTNAERIRRARLQAHAVAAAEQCGGTFVPDVSEPRRLGDVVSDWPEDRRLIFADEALAGAEATLAAAPDAGKWAILIGPEGGFSAAERARLNAMPQVFPIALGPRMLRADTAAVAALTLWQSERGDWG